MIPYELLDRWKVSLRTMNSCFQKLVTNKFSFKDFFAKQYKQIRS